jgi:hypothetical protein
MRVRNAREDAPAIWLVTPNKRAVKHPVDKMFRTGIIAIVEGRPVLSPNAKDEGWRLLQDECTPEEWAAWKVFAEQEAKAKGRLRLAQEHRPACLQGRVLSKNRSTREYVPPAVVAADKPKVSKAGTAPQKSE